MHPEARQLRHRTFARTIRMWASWIRARHIVRMHGNEFAQNRIGLAKALPAHVNVGHAGQGIAGIGSIAKASLYSCSASAKRFSFSNNSPAER